MSAGAAVAGTPRRIQFGIPKPDSRVYEPPDTFAGWVRRWIDRERTKFPGLTNSELALLERLASDLEAP